MEVGTTGHRPNKLWGYDLSHPSYVKLRKCLHDLFIEEKVEKVYTGMALGFDTVVALAAIDCKEEGHDIKLIACIPCANQESRWNYNDQKLYWEILRRCDSIYGVDEKGSEIPLTIMYIDEGVYELWTLEPSVYEVEYQPWLMQSRNKVIVNHCDTLIALWDGTSGGTANCIKYAKQTGRVNIRRLNPRDYE